jgi:hypothetical protein
MVLVLRGAPQRVGDCKREGEFLINDIKRWDFPFGTLFFILGLKETPNGGIKEVSAVLEAAIFRS